MTNTQIYGCYTGICNRPHMSMHTYISPLHYRDGAHGLNLLNIPCTTIQAMARQYARVTDVLALVVLWRECTEKVRPVRIPLEQDAEQLDTYRRVYRPTVIPTYDYYMVNCRTLHTAVVGCK